MAELSSEVQELRRQLASERQARQQAEQQLQELEEEQEESGGRGGAAAAAELEALKAKNAKLKERYKVGKVWKRGTWGVGWLLLAACYLASALLHVETAVCSDPSCGVLEGAAAMSASDLCCSDLYFGASS